MKKEILSLVALWAGMCPFEVQEIHSAPVVEPVCDTVNVHKKMSAFGQKSDSSRSKQVANPGLKDWANFSRYKEANAAIHEPVKVVFMGNSITDFWPRLDPEFFTSNGYVGRGISGQVSAQMVMRFRKDVIDLHPQVVVILPGTNDIALNSYAMSLEDTFNNVQTMVDLARANHIQVVLCSTMPAYQFGWRPELKPADEIIRLNRIMKLYAEENHLPFVDYHSAMKDERNGLPQKYSSDGVHPNLEGYKVMEELVQKVLKPLVR